MAPVAVNTVAAEGRHFDRMRRSCRLKLPPIFRKRNQDYSELRSHGVRLGKDAHNFMRRGVGGDVVVGRLAAQQHVADTSPGKVRLKAVPAKFANHMEGVLL